MSKDNTIFEFPAYKPYLIHKLGRKSERKGQRSALAKNLLCQPTFISQVLNGTSDFNLEQSERVSEFLGHTPDEKHFFLLLVQKDRAGTKPLRTYFEKQIQEILEKRFILVERLGKRTSLSKEAQSIYYSSWIYAACHIALTIPALQSRKSLAVFFNLPLVKINEVIEYLEEVGLAQIQGERVITSQNTIRIGRDSHSMTKHHMNLRTQAMESLDREKMEDLHYSSIFSLSRKDRVRLKDLLMELIKTNAEIVQDSESEDLCALSIDLFSLQKGIS
jgi:uncharacterized protein (TIGR02147 family)